LLTVPSRVRIVPALFSVPPWASFKVFGVVYLIEKEARKSKLLMSCRTVYRIPEQTLYAIAGTNSLLKEKVIPGSV
jgi:hypothetical protein